MEHWSAARLRAVSYFSSGFSPPREQSGGVLKALDYLPGLMFEIKGEKGSLASLADGMRRLPMIDDEQGRRRAVGILRQGSLDSSVSAHSAERILEGIRDA